jgi:K+-transporting ATPase ATPase B chain
VARPGGVAAPRPQGPGGARCAARRCLALRQRTQAAAAELRPGDYVIVSAGELIPADGEIVQAAWPPSTSPPSPANPRRCCARPAPTAAGVIGGTKVLSDEIVVRVTAEPGHSFLDRMIALVEGANRQKTPNEIALTLLLAAMTLTFLIVVAHAAGDRGLRRRARSIRCC